MGKQCGHSHSLAPEFICQLQSGHSGVHECSFKPSKIHRTIFERVLNELQALDELGGAEDLEQYLETMIAIKQEIKKRIKIAGSM